MATTTKRFVASKGVSWAKLMLAQYDRYDERIGVRMLHLQGSYVDEGGHGEGEMILLVEITGSDLIESERPFPGKGVVMQPRDWWIRGRLLTGEKVEGHFAPRRQFCVLLVECRDGD